MSAATMNEMERLRAEIKDARVCAENWEANAKQWSRDWHELRDERDALSAHAAATTVLMNRLFLCDDYSANGEGDGTSDGLLVPAELAEEFADLSATTPTTSLARRDLIKQAEALERLGPGLVDIIDRSQAKRMAAELRRQAKEGE